MNADLYENSTLEKWLRENNITTKRFSKLVGCSRVTIYKAKLDAGITSKISNKIKELTDGEVVLKIAERGKDSSYAQDNS